MNLGSKFNKVKQQASLFLRGDKTDVIGTLRDAEDRTDELRVLSDAISRSLEKRLYTYNVTDEKKLSKVPETQVAELMREGLKEVASCQQVEQLEKSLFRCVVEEAVTMEKMLGNIVLDYEQQVGNEVLPFLHMLLKDHFPSLSKQKKALKQAGQDLDAAKGRLRNSLASNTGHAKVDSQRYGVDEAESKLEQIKDSYACDLFSTLSHQREIAHLTCLNIEIKLEFLQRSVLALNTLLPPLQKLLRESPCGPVYSVSLGDHLGITQRKIALPMEVCVKRLIEIGLKEEGLFRMAGSATKIKRLRCAFDAGILLNDSLSTTAAAAEYDVHVVAGALKSYLRELPEPLLTHARHDQWIEAAGKTDHEERLRALWQVATSLPEQNHQNLAYIMKFLSMLAKHSAHNKMTASNIAIVVAPNLIWTHTEDSQLQLSTLGRNMTLSNDYKIVVEQMIEYCGYFFKEDVDFGVQPLLNDNHVDGDRAGGAMKTHNRNNSSDLGFLVANDDNELESPKQPHGTRKEPAPKPPALKKVDLQSADNTPEMSPSLRRSHSPSVTSVPRAKSRYVRRPTEEPPAPPVNVGNKPPPRPHPPFILEAGSEDANKDPSTVSNESDEHKPPLEESPEEYVALRESTAASSEFRKSLEGILRQPQPLPRHLTRMSTSYPESASEAALSPVKLGLPVAAQRSFRKCQQQKLESVLSDKPVIAEKPSSFQRPAFASEHSRPLVPEKPFTFANKPQTKSTIDVEAGAISAEKIDSANAASHL